MVEGGPEMEFKKLFEPITIHGVTIKNRIVMPSMGLAYSTDFSFNDRYRAFYRERARGGVGLMTIGPVSIDRVGSAPFMSGLHDDSFVVEVGCSKTSGTGELFIDWPGKYKLCGYVMDKKNLYV